MRNFIPESEDYEEKCGDCGEYCVPFWTRCKCDELRKPTRKLDDVLRQILESEAQIVTKKDSQKEN